MSHCCCSLAWIRRSRYRQKMSFSGAQSVSTRTKFFFPNIESLHHLGGSDETDLPPKYKFEENKLNHFKLYNCHLAKNTVICLIISLHLIMQILLQQTAVLSFVATLITELLFLMNYKCESVNTLWIFWEKKISTKALSLLSHKQSKKTPKKSHYLTQKLKQ